MRELSAYVGRGAIATFWSADVEAAAVVLVLAVDAVPLESTGEVSCSGLMVTSGGCCCCCCLPLGDKSSDLIFGAGPLGWAAVDACAIRGCPLTGPLPVLLLPIRGPVCTFFGHDCIGHGH